MTTTLQAEQQGVHIERTIDIKASPRAVWDALLDEVGPKSTGENGKPMNMKLEAWPGGRLYRDLGNNTGHLWGHVQVIKPPALLEIWGPLFMSFAAVNHVQYRITENGNGARLKLIHRAFGEIPAEYRDGMAEGWSEILENIRKASEQR
ncbi:MAG: SRPBCC domain-containing protein [Phycisphaerales bacterium]|nr:SRPBCC domain-containing protein [Phycisphaerales bacterium]MCI0674479.1 SRPBCC domain-containing protein [Phycisphaerales bacterium]